MEQTLIDEIVRRIVEVANPDRIILFGSASQGKGEKANDVDLLVVKTGVPHRRRLAQQIHLKMFGIGFPIDILVATPQDIQEQRNKVGSIVGVALREGVEIYAA
ncbi:hypothetical protein ES703_54302 [subsurface metagenome]